MELGLPLPHHLADHVLPAFLRVENKPIRLTPVQPASRFGRNSTVALDLLLLSSRTAIASCLSVQSCFAVPLRCLLPCKRLSCEILHAD